MLFELFHRHKKKSFLLCFLYRLLACSYVSCYGHFDYQLTGYRDAIMTPPNNNQNNGKRLYKRQRARSSPGNTAQECRGEFASLRGPNDTNSNSCDFSDNEIRHDIQLLYLNCCGFKSKLKYPEFENLIRLNDFVCFVETKTDIYVRFNRFTRLCIQI